MFRAYPVSCLYKVIVACCFLSAVEPLEWDSRHPRSCIGCFVLYFYGFIMGLVVASYRVALSPVSCLHKAVACCFLLAGTYNHTP